MELKARRAGAYYVKQVVREYQAMPAGFVYPAAQTPFTSQNSRLRHVGKRPRRSMCPRHTVRPSARLPDTLESAANAALLSHGLAITSTEWKPPTLKVFIEKGTEQDVGATVDDCATASRVVGDLLEDVEFGGATGYTLEVSTPGAAEVLTADHEFAAFKGFPVAVTTTEEFKKKLVFEGHLVGRTDAAVRVGLGGRVVNIPREIVQEVRLSAGVEEF